MKHFPERTARRRLLSYLFSLHRVDFDSVAAAVKHGAISVEQWIDLLDAHRAACRSEAQLAHWGPFEPSAFARAVIAHDANPALPPVKLIQLMPLGASPRARPAKPIGRPPPPQRPGLEARP